VVALGRTWLTIVGSDVAFTFDDGPYTYTSDLLDKLKVYSAKATFMISELVPSIL
jgi:peptidoglycan/xylan/chitin deacetylase (PgdA/CDA1 family)